MLITINKSFIRPHLDYCDAIYDHPNNKSFYIKIELIQYNAVVDITRGARETSQIKLHKELEPESLRFRRWFSRPCTFFKTQIRGIPEYLLNEIPKIQIHYNTRNTDHVEIYYCNMDIFYIFFFPFAINGWSIFDLDVLKSKSYAIFLNTL